MRIRLLRRCAGFATARLVKQGFLIAVAILLLTGAVLGQERGSEALPFWYTGKTPPKVILQEPMDTSPKPWKGKFLPDGQPDVHGGVWRITDAGNGHLHNPQVGATNPDANTYKPKPSRIIDPPDGLPPYQPWALALRRNQELALIDPTRPEHFDPQGQCLSGIPKLNYYVSSYTILQSPGYIAFAWELYHQYRVIPLDGSPHISPSLKLWMGDGRGRWEGNTLVVDTTNINGKARLNVFGDFFSSKAHLTERFVFMTPDTMIYEVTIDDPAVFTRPWTMRVNRHERTKDTEIWEDTCKEWRDIRPSALTIPLK